MVRRVVAGFLLLLVVGALAPARAAAQVDHALGFNLGYFAVRGEDARITDDVLLENLHVLAFGVGDFSGASGGAEWLVGVSRTLEAAIGVGIYRRSVPSVYRDFVNADGSEIAQDLRLRIAPVSAAVRFFPLGRREAFQPYVGAGVALLRWRYSETGEFVDFHDSTIFRDRFVATGTDVGPLVLGGVRFPIGDVLSAGGEVRYQGGTGRVGLDRGFLAEQIDLGGITTQVTFQVRF